MGARTETYRLVAANGRHIRMATRVVFPDGRKVSFLERLPKRLAIAKAVALLAKAEVA